eukprot:814388_1
MVFYILFYFFMFLIFSFLFFFFLYFVNFVTHFEYFEIHYTIHNTHCVEPSISFSFEEIDFMTSDKFLQLFDNDNSEIQKCTGKVDTGCGNWIKCFSALKSLGVNKIGKDETYVITIFEP